MAVTAEATQASQRWRGVRLWLVVALLAGLPFIFYWRLFTPDTLDRGALAGSALSRQYASMLYLAQSLAAGEFPLWCGGSSGGFPFVADVGNAALYPPRLLAVLVASPWGFPYLAMELEVVAHYSLAGVLAFLLGRRLFTHDGAALLVALTFAFGGYLTGCAAQQPAALQSAVWLPLALLCADHAIVGGRVLSRWTVVLAVTLATSVLGGHPATALCVYCLVAVYGLWRAPRGARAVAVAFVLSLGLVAVQLLPTGEYVLLAARVDLASGTVSPGLPREIVQVLLPDVAGAYSPLYVGILPLMLAAAAMVPPRRPAVRFWPAVLVASLLLALASQVFLQTLPWWVALGGGEPLALVASFAAGMLAGHGAEALLSREWGVVERQRFVRGVGWVLWLLVVLVVASFVGLVAQGWTPASSFYGLMGAAVYALIVATLAWALLRWWLLGGGPAGAFVALATALLLFDLFSVGWRQSLSAALPEAHAAEPVAADVLGRPVAPSLDPATTAVVEEPLATPVAPATGKECVAVVERGVLRVNASARTGA